MSTKERVTANKAMDAGTNQKLELSRPQNAATRVIENDTAMSNSFPRYRSICADRAAVVGQTNFDDAGSVGSNQIYQSTVIHTARVINARRLSP
jgi:hypothetical protein